jgi:uncharacterized membrane protein/CBS domain-containing protein
MQVREVMTRGVECIHPGASLQEAARKMRECGVGSLPVCGDHGRLVGMVTDRDMTVRAVAEGLDPWTTRVRDVVTPQVVHVREDQDVTEAARLMKGHGIRRVVVLDRGGRLAGIVSLGDLAVETRDAKLAGATLEAVSEPGGPAGPVSAGRAGRVPGRFRSRLRGYFAAPGTTRSGGPGRGLLGGVGLGAGLMYLLDPDLGRRRRALARDRAVRAVGRIDDCVNAAACDLAHRARGVAAEVRARLVSEQVSDDVLVERVRSRIGRYVAHPHALGVAARNGQVVLTGSVLKGELDRLLDAVGSVRGVRGLDAGGLAAHDEPGDRPWLQGGRRLPGERPNLLQESWAPATRLLAGAAGCGLMANCLARRTPAAVLLGTAGFGLFVRSLASVSLGRLVGAAGGRPAVDVQKTVTIRGPVERVFPFFVRYQAFPSFMAHLREVRDLGGGRSRWVAEVPGGMAVRWDAVVTRCEPNRLLAWRSEPGSAVAHAGFLRLEPTPEGDTRMHIHFSYTPPGGLLGHFAAMLFGADARSAMDEDLVRL